MSHPGDTPAHPAAVDVPIQTMTLSLLAWLLRPITERLERMSDTFHTDLTALTDSVTALTDEVTAGLSANATAIQALKDQIAAGSPVTAADLATLETSTAAIGNAVATLKASLNP